MLEILEKGLGKPSLRNNSSKQNHSGTTPTTLDNNNTTKLLNGVGSAGSTADSNPVTTAILNGKARELTPVIKQEPRDPVQHQQTVNVNANVNVIELKPNSTMIKLEPTKMEIDIKDLNNITFTSDDLNALDNSLTLDPALNDLALQVSQTTPNGYCLYRVRLQRTHVYHENISLHQHLACSVKRLTPVQSL